MVAKAFLAKDDEKQDQVNHIDGDKSNNVLVNLEWCSQQENSIHSMKIMHVHSRRVVAKNIATGQIKEFDSIAEATQYGFCRSNIQKCIDGKRTKHGGCQWFDAQVLSVHGIAIDAAIDAELAKNKK